MRSLQKSASPNDNSKITSTKHDSEEIFGLLVENIKDYAIFVVDTNGFIASWNKGAEKIKGYSAGEIIGKHISVFYRKEDIEKNIPTHNLQAAAKGHYENEGWRVRKDGSFFWADVVFTALYNDDGSLKGFAKVTRDITDRKEAEDKLHYLANLLEKTSDAIFSYDAQFRLLSWNKAAEIMYGYTAGEVLYKNAADVLRPEIEENARREIRADIEKNGFWMGEISHRRKDGSSVLVYISLTVTKNEANNIEEYVCICRDITSRKKEEENIRLMQSAIERLTQEKLNYSLKEVSDYKYALDRSCIVAITDQKGIIQYVNENFCIISKYSSAELIGQDHRIINSGYHPKEFIRNLWVTIANGKVWKGEIKNKAKDGTYYWVDTTIVPFLNADGKPYQYVAIRADITERKDAEEARQRHIEIEMQTRAKLDFSLKEISDYKYALDKSCIVAITDQKGIIQYVNENFCIISKYSSAELIGQDHRIINSGYHPKEFIRSLWVTIANGKVWKGEIKNKAKDGNYYWVDTTIVPFLNEDGKPYQYVAIRADITERKTAEEELYQLNDQLEDRVKSRTRQFEVANKELESFSYSVSHDLRAPLRGVSGFAKILEEDYGQLLDEEGNRLLNKISTSARTMGQLIDDLLTFSRTGRKEVVGNTINMETLVANCVHELLPGNGNAICSVEIQKLAECAGDISLIKQVWLNLIGNAIKYSAKASSPKIIIGNIEDETRQVYFVKDNGVGFDMQYAHKLFGVFQRLHSTEEFEGTGVGLALTKLIINKHHGEVWAKSEPGKGAAFYFSLPKKTLL